MDRPNINNYDDRNYRSRHSSQDSLPQEKAEDAIAKLDWNRLQNEKPSIPPSDNEDKDSGSIRKQIFLNMGKVNMNVIDVRTKHDPTGQPCKLDNFDVQHFSYTPLELLRDHAKAFFPAYFGPLLEEFDIFSLTSLEKRLIPNLISNSKLNVLVQAPTNSGKTFSYLLAVVEHLCRRLIYKVKSGDKKHHFHPTNQQQQTSYEIIGSSIRREPRVLIIVPDADTAFHVREMLVRITKLIADKVNIYSDFYTMDQVSRGKWYSQRSWLDVLILTPKVLLKYLDSGLIDIHKFEWLVIDGIDKICDSNDMFNRLLSLINPHAAEPEPNVNDDAMVDQVESDQVEFEFSTDDDDVPCDMVIRKAKIKFHVQNLQTPEDKPPLMPKVCKEPPSPWICPRLIVLAESLTDMTGMRDKLMSSHYLRMSVDDPVPTEKLNIDQKFVKVNGEKIAVLRELLEKKLAARAQVMVLIKEAPKKKLDLFEKHVNWVLVQPKMPSQWIYQSLGLFYRRRVPVLVATYSMASRIKVSNIDCVILYDVPTSLSEYHIAIERVGILGRPGQSYLFVNPKHFSREESLFIMGLIDSLFDANVSVPSFLIDMVTDSEFS